MRSKRINRRDFLKLTATYGLTSKSLNLNAATFDENDSNAPLSASQIDSDYVIVNGWLLLKSDLNLKIGV